MDSPPTWLYISVATILFIADSALAAYLFARSDELRLQPVAWLMSAAGCFALAAILNLYIVATDRSVVWWLGAVLYGVGLTAYIGACATGLRWLVRRRREPVSVIGWESEYAIMLAAALILFPCSMALHQTLDSRLGYPLLVLEPLLVLSVGAAWYQAARRRRLEG